MSKDPSKYPKGSIRLTLEGEDEVLKRQEGKCHKCKVYFSPPNPLAVYFRLIKPKVHGGGFHKISQLKDYGNVAAYCWHCLEKETASVPVAVRFKKAELEEYYRWMEGKPRYANKQGKPPNFSRMVKDSLNFITDQEYFNDLIGGLKKELEDYENEAKSFLEILKLYNAREDDISFAKEVVRFFQYYRPPYPEITTNEDIDNRTSDPSTREFLKSLRDENLKRIIDQKEAGYLYYQTNSELFKE